MAFFVRPINPSESKLLSKLIDNNHNDPDYLLQLRIVLLSSQRFKTGEISRQLKVSQNVVLSCIKRFNQQGLEDFSLGGGVGIRQHNYHRHNYRLNLANTSFDVQKPVRQYSINNAVSSYSRRQQQIDEAIRQLLGTLLENLSVEVNLTDNDLGTLSAFRLEFEEWRKRPLESEYLYVYLDEVEIPIPANFSDDNKKEYNIRAVLGINNNGKREFLGVWEGLGWREILHNLEQRGLRGAKLWVVPGIEECRQVIRQSFPEQAQGYCRIDLERELSEVIEPEISTQVARRIKEIFRQQSYAAAKPRWEALINDLEGVSFRVAAVLAQNSEEYLNYLLMPRPHWFYLKSTHCVREAFVYLKRWTTQIYEPENLSLMLYAIAVSLPHRFLKAEI